VHNVGRNAESEALAVARRVKMLGNICNMEV